MTPGAEDLGKTLNLVKFMMKLGVGNGWRALGEAFRSLLILSLQQSQLFGAGVTWGLWTVPMSCQDGHHPACCDQQRPDYNSCVYQSPSATGFT